MKEFIFRLLATIFAIGVIGTVGGIEFGFLTYGRGLLQIAICFAGAGICHRIAEAIRNEKCRRKMAERVIASRKGVQK